MLEKETTEQKVITQEQVPVKTKGFFQSKTILTQILVIVLMSLQVLFPALAYDANELTTQILGMDWSATVGATAILGNILTILFKVFSKASIINGIFRGN